MGSETLDISKKIIDEISSLDGNWSIVVYDNNVTPFTVVFYVLKTVVPLTDDEAFEKTNEIHTVGQSIVYTGNRIHCYRIQAALSQISVRSEIIQ